MDHGPDHQALGIPERVARAAIDVLAAVVTPRATHQAGCDRLAVDDGCCWLGITPYLHADGGMQSRVEPLPQAVHTPEAKVVIHGLPRRPIMGHQPPSTT